MFSRELFAIESITGGQVKEVAFPGSELMSERNMFDVRDSLSTILAVSKSTSCDGSTE